MFLLAAGSEEVEHRAAAMGALDPLVGGAELEHGKLGLSGDKVDRVDQRRSIDAVERLARRFGLDIHGGLLIALVLQISRLALSNPIV